MTPKVFPQAKNHPTLSDVASLIKAGKVKNIVVASGAGISTAAGIPDFRSPDTGLYANLQAYDLPHPQAIFELSYFVERPEAFFTLAKELYPGNFEPTWSHYFFVLLHKHKLLRRIFTQNIDTLERRAGVPADLIVEAHGSFATATCLKCRSTTTAEELKPRIDLGEVVRCNKASCKGKQDALIKPDIVFFGEGLPKDFFSRLSDLDRCDLLLVMGTSLQVQPFASVVNRVRGDCPRVLINLESVGELDDFDTTGSFFSKYREDGFDFDGRTRGGPSKARDVRWLGEADKAVLELVDLLGWRTELEEIRKSSEKKLNASKEASKTSVKTATPATMPVDTHTDAHANAEKLASKFAEATEVTRPKDEADAITKKLDSLSIAQKKDTEDPEQAEGAKKPAL